MEQQAQIKGQPQWRWIKLHQEKTTKEKDAKEEKEKVIGEHGRAMQRERRLAEIMVEEREEVKVKAESQEQRKEEKTKVAKQSLVEMCVGFGHWGNECPNRRNVREVAGSEVTAQAPSESTATLTIAPSQSASQYRVRRVGEMMRPSFYHMPVTPPSELEIHYVGSDEEEDQESLEGWCVRRIGVYCVNVSHAESSEEHVGKAQERTT